MYRNALLTTDGSDTARAAFPHVKQVVDPSGDVTIVQVIDDVARVLRRTTPAGFEFGSAGAFSDDIATEVVQAQRSEAQMHLEEARAVLDADGLQNIHTEILEGLPGDSVVRFAKERGCDVVIMATHGRGGLRRTVLGSVADHVLRHLEGVPVVLVHPPDE